MKQKLFSFALAAVLALPAAPAAAGDVVVTIKPPHSIVQAILGETEEARLLMSDNQSVHGAVLKPSQVRALYDADVVFYIHEELELFLPKELHRSASAQAAASFPGVNLIRNREEGEGGHEEHDDHDDHGHEDEHAHKDEHGHDDHDEHAHGAYDTHIWLDIANAKSIATQVMAVLSARAPQHATTYAGNNAALQQRLDALDNALAQKLAAVKGVEYVVFHDAYQYLEKRYNLQPPTPLLAQPHLPASARRLSEVKRTIEKHDIKCAFAEPQFSSKPLRAIANEGVQVGILDPLGAELTPGADLYPALMQNIADEMAGCLGR